MCSSLRRPAIRSAGCGRSRSETVSRLSLYGGEAVRRRGEVVGRLRSCGYGYTVGRMIALATLPTGLDVGDVVDVELFGDTVPAHVENDALYDPEGARTSG